MFKTAILPPKHGIYGYIVVVMANSNFCRGAGHFKFHRWEIMQQQQNQVGGEPSGSQKQRLCAAMNVDLSCVQNRAMTRSFAIYNNGKTVGFSLPSANKAKFANIPRPSQRFAKWVVIDNTWLARRGYTPPENKNEKKRSHSSMRSPPPAPRKQRSYSEPADLSKTVQHQEQYLPPPPSVSTCLSVELQRCQTPRRTALRQRPSTPSSVSSLAWTPLRNSMLSAPPTPTQVTSLSMVSVCPRL